MQWPPSDDTATAETIIDIPTNITSQNVIENGAFGGIFCYGGIPDRCWINNDLMIINSLSGHNWGALLIDIKNKTIQKLDKFTEIEAFFNDIKTEICRDFCVLDVDDKSGNILFQTSSIQRGHTVNIYNINTKKIYNLSKTIDYERNNNELIQSISNIQTQIIQNKIESQSDDESKNESENEI